MDWLQVLSFWLTDAAHNSSDWLRRIADPGLWVLSVFLVWVAAALVTARFMALLSSGSSRDWSEKTRRWITLAAILLILTGSAVWTFVGTTGQPPRNPVDTFFAVCSVIFGVLVLGNNLGQKLRMQVQVLDGKGEKSSTKAAYVLARMESLGSSKPRGLLFPHGTDTANLPESALVKAETSQSKIAAAVIALVRSVTSVTPWKAELIMADDATVAVTLSRHGRRVDSELISAQALLPRDPNQDQKDTERALLTAAAAFLLVTLSRTYPLLREGLAGAERWQSVAAQVLATTAPWRNDRKISAELFAQAVQEDHENLAAWLGLLVKRTGSYGSRQTLEWSLDRLKGLLAELDKRERLRKPTELALRIRLLRNLVVFYTNYRLLLTEPSEQAKRRNVEKEALNLAGSLLDAVNAASSSENQPQIQDYAKRMRPLAASMYCHVNALQLPTREAPRRQHATWLNTARNWMPKENALATPRFHYDQACAAMEENPSGIDEALRHLELALALGELRNGAASDPSLKALRGDPRFAALTETQVRVTSLVELKLHSTSLTSAGIRFASDFLTWNKAEGDTRLATTLNVPTETVTWIRGICELADCCFDSEMATEWTNLLTGEGVNDITGLRALVARHNSSFATRYARLARAAETASVEAPTAQDLRRWAYAS